MNEIGRVEQLNGRAVLIRGGELGSCFGCLNEDCQLNGCRFTAENRKGLALTIGQLVEVGVSNIALVSQAVLVFFPPVAGFIVAWLITASVLAVSSEALRAAVGLVGLASGFLAVYIFRKRYPAKVKPEVLRVISETTAEPVDDSYSFN